MNGLTMDAFRSGKFSKATSAFTAFMFTFVFYLSPNSKAVADELSKEDARQAQVERLLENTPEKKLAHRLEKLKRKLTKELPRKLAQRNADKGWMNEALQAVGLGAMPLQSEDVKELEKLKKGVERAYEQAIHRFEREDEKLSARGNLPEEVKDLIRERHAAAVEKVKRQYAELTTKLEQLLKTQDPDEQQSLLDDLSDSLGKEQFKRRPTADDPNQLPWRVPSDKVREPKTNKRNLQAALGIDPYTGYLQFASSELTQDMLALTSLADEKGVTEADLANTIDIQITDAIQDLAQSLNNNPVEIYTWVHNNIRFVPSYGSIQGSQYTLETKRGNAIDTASLLIALLRAADIPAKYAYGTVEIPVDKVMNWVGGVTTPEAAQSLLGQGGIPNTALIEGGKITKIRMEHTWVEAFVDFEPSRGIKNRAGDNWIPMDASFKQYEFKAGMAVSEQVSFDVQALQRDVEQNAQISEDEGWVKGVPQTDIESHLRQFEEQIADYIASQDPDAEVGEVLGLQKIEVLPPRPLAAGLPYAHIVTQDSFSEVPDNLRHRFKYELATQSYGYPNAPFIALNEPTVKLAGKKLALSFVPATDDDRVIIQSYIPEPDPDSGEIDPASVPNTLPGYLINLSPEIVLDGEVVQRAGAQTMGTELHETLGLYSPSHNWHTSNNNPIVGQYRAIGLDLQGISPEQAQRLKQDLESTKTTLKSGAESQLNTLTKHDVLGDLIYATIMSYFALNDAHEEAQSEPANMVTYRLPSYGVFSTTVQPSYWFGVPRDTTFSGLTIDVDAVTYHGVAKDNDKKTQAQFTEASGMRWSAMEHWVPEQVFSIPGSQAHGISAVKALALATAQGQKVWTIDRNNLSLALEQIDLGSEVETEIRNAVMAGKVATAHEAQIIHYNWVGSGYLLIDPETGAGAYKIAGGANGGQLTNVASFMDALSWIALAFGVNGSLQALVGSPIGAVVSLIAGGINLLSSVLAWGLTCGDAAATALFSFLALAMFVMGLVFATLGPFGIVVAIGIAFAMQAAAVRLSSYTNDCR